jgi:hypothetical protein
MTVDRFETYQHVDSYSSAAIIQQQRNNNGGSMDTYNISFNLLELVFN